MKLPNDPLPVGVMSLKDVNLYTLRLDAEKMRLETLQRGFLDAALAAAKRRFDADAV